MNSKAIIWIFMAIGSTVFSFIPMLWGSDMLSASSFIFGTVGAILGIYIGFKITR